MEPDELLRKIRVLEEGQEELKREIGKLIPGQSSASPPPPPPPRRPFPALQSLQQATSSRGRALALLHQSPSSSSRPQRPGLSDRHCHRILQSLGQAVHVISLEGKVLYWNRFAEHLYGYCSSEAIGQDLLELICDPCDFSPAHEIIRNIFMGKCWRGKFPVKHKSGERFSVVVNNTPLYDEDGSLVGLTCLSGDARILEEIVGPSVVGKSYPNSAKPHLQVNNKPRSSLPQKCLSDSQQPLQSAITSKITNLATKVTSRVRSRIRSGQSCDEQDGNGRQGQYSDHDAREELTSSEASTPGGDVLHGAFVTEEKSPVNSRKTNSDDSGQGKGGFQKIFSSKAEALLTKKGISWPWKGNENDGGCGKNNMTSPPLHDKQENTQIRQGVPVLEPIIIPDSKDTEYAQAGKYEVSGSWWTFNNNSTSSTMSSTVSSNSSPIERVDYEADCLDYEILWEDLTLGEQVGEGSCGTVYHALWYGSDVAVKVFSRQEYSEEMIRTFRQEVSLMKKLRHPNIILFMGAVASQERLCIVTEFLPRGSLFRLLRKTTGKLDPRRRVHMAIDIARGMNYLHSSSPTVVHRDLKSSNLLVDKNWTVKVADFGLSRLKIETFLTTKTGKGTPQWMAPEVLRNEPSNEKSDVYSYGVVLWELVTQKIPWDTLNTMQVIGAVGFMDHRLEIPGDIDPQWASMIESCWDSDPQRRPSFQELLERLRELQKKYALQVQMQRSTAGKGAEKMSVDDG
ncbi:RGS domain-containing serine/threonine-protein kinase A-like isoform X1 [Triticum urartu]|uniref:non-specific serine/threonine protein kinase n=1 Tax=Triticum urartu TaxID=4572 RepID=A0A8R7U756_TRIUA|nr:RGS domain-containing serine/threonine-protein kinase A-like isoform X1 [Triticum urartu]